MPALPGEVLGDSVTLTIGTQAVSGSPANTNWGYATEGGVYGTMSPDEFIDFDYTTAIEVDKFRWDDLSNNFVFEVGPRHDSGVANNEGDDEGWTRIEVDGTAFVRTDASTYSSLQRRWTYNSVSNPFAAAGDGADITVNFYHASGASTVATYYVNQAGTANGWTAGNDSNGGTSISDAKLTWQGVHDLGLTAGDIVTYNIVSQGLFGSSSEEVTFEVVGVAAADLSFSLGSGTYAPTSFFPENIDPTSVSVFADIVDEQVPALRRELADVNGVFAIETAIFTRLITSLVGTFTAFPSLVAALGLIVGGVVIANSVALATMERRSEIAVMKAVGLQRERVLGMLLLENGILGFIGGLIGVGIGLVALVGLATASGVPLDAIPWNSAFLLMMLCVGVAVFAAMTSAWAASGEKPLTVLRYE